MKKLVATLLILVAVLGIMFAEYRYIMTNIKPYVGEDNAVYLEVFDQVDEYHADEWEE
jgi:hypothetical protein